jgi:hypothetical protein
MANLLVEEPDALMRARPDLWEPWVSNHPGPPGPPLVNCLRFPQQARTPTLDNTLRLVTDVGHQMQISQH